MIYRNYNYKKSLVSVRETSVTYYITIKVRAVTVSADNVVTLTHGPTLMADNNVK